MSPYIWEIAPLEKAQKRPFSRGTLLGGFQANSPYIGEICLFSAKNVLKMLLSVVKEVVNLILTGSNLFPKPRSTLKKPHRQSQFAPL